jgi:4-amino-4-deoxy-L-arabinose transferase-like glycosyltransferase
MKAAKLFALLFLVVLAARLCHLRILWAEEQLPVAAAMEMARGKALYRDVWFDKPPWVAGVYLLWGARMGWPLRLAGALFVTLCCLLAWRFARDLWGEREAWLAAAFLAFFLTFGLPAAVIPLAADSLLLLPHLAAVYLASRQRPLAAGLLAGIGLLFNAKAVFVLAACLLWLWLPNRAATVRERSGRFDSQLRSAALLLAGFLLPLIAALAWFAAHGSVPDYVLQVWRLGSMYAGATFLEHPWQAGVVRTANWLGFHLALAVGAAWFLLRSKESGRWRFAAWALLSLAGIALGLRFFPRYYFLLLPPLALAAARGYSLMPRRAACALLALTLAIPLVRFGPRYGILARDLLTGRPHSWRDITMYQDSQQAAQRVLALAPPGARLFVWGYRPDLYVYTGLPAASRFLESQPLSGVLADRHLFRSDALRAPFIEQNRRELMRSRPDIIVDGLGPYNSSLGIEKYPDLAPWLANYELVSRTRSVVIYRLRLRR